MALRRQEIHCHECNQYVQFSIDDALEGQHVLTCPKCGHEHCRVVKNGEITDERWGQRNSNFSSSITYTVSGIITSSANSTYITSMAGSTAVPSNGGAQLHKFFYQAWSDTVT